MHRNNALCLLVTCCLAACDSPQSTNNVPAVAASEARINPQNWPPQGPVRTRDPAMEQRIADLIARMTVEEKVGQVIQADINSVTPEQVREYNLGSVLNGGGSAPGGDNRTTPDKWLALADAFWHASTDTSDGGVGIPAIWGTDAVHGHSNVLGATIFPHNIGLGMADDPELMYDIGRVTALEMLATGLDWTFAPTIAVVRNDRWGRTYESYSEDPRIVAEYAPRIIEGIQGKAGTADFLGNGHMLATAKHFAGDGGTSDGRDQGDTVIPEAEFRDVQAAAYPPAIRAGVQSVMASFNSYHGRKMHGYKEMLSHVLVGRMGFDGFVVGDWNGHGQVGDCSNTSCAAAFNAGLDMFMAPDSWERLYDATLQQVRSGEISVARLDQAVGRILRVKLRAGVFDAGPPSTRPHAGDFSLLASDAHRAVARTAVRQSLVLLKNENGLLPLLPTRSVLVAGDGAHSIGKQCGGWTLNWQGTGNLNEHFPNGTSIFDGIAAAMRETGGHATLSEDGSFSERPDVAIVVFGEDPYAEFQGDRPNVDYPSDDGLRLLQGFRAAGIPTVSIFLSGRPLWINPELNASDALVAAWLPGTEGAGIADLILANADGEPRHDFTGRLSFSWPAGPGQAGINVGDADYDPLFGYGYGLSYRADATVPLLPENIAVSAAGESSRGTLMEFGDPVGDWRMLLRDAGGEITVVDSRAESADGHLELQPADRDVQEDTVIARWSGAASLVIAGAPLDLGGHDDDTALLIDYRVIDADSTEVSIAMGQVAVSHGAVDITDGVRRMQGAGWQTARLALRCFEENGADLAAISEALTISSSGPLVLQLRDARLVSGPPAATCSF